MSAAFYNTINITGDELRAAIVSAQHQDAAILAIYANARGPLSPSDVHWLCESAGKRWPMTSVRRAISNMTKTGALTKTGTFKRGVFGTREHLWMLAV